MVSMLPVLAAVSTAALVCFLVRLGLRAAERRRLERFGVRSKELSTQDPESHRLSTRLFLLAGAILMAVSRLLPHFQMAATTCAVLLLSALGFSVLKHKAEQRKHRQLLLAELPGLIDITALCVQGGLPLAAALREAVRFHRGAIGAFFRQLLKTAEAGTDLATALKQGVERAETPEVRSVCRTLASALLLGVPAAETLAELSTYAARRRRQNLEERINSLPVRLTLVAMLLLLPPVVVLVVLPNLAGFFQSPW